MILDEVTNGKNVVSVCREFGFCQSTFYNYLDADPERGVRFATAVDRGADVMADEQLTIADDKTDSPQSRAVRCKARQWLLERRHSKKYGAKIDVTSNDKVPPPNLEDFYKSIAVDVPQARHVDGGATIQ